MPKGVHVCLPQRQPGWRSGEVYLKPAGPTYWWLHPTLLATPPIGVLTQVVLNYKASIEKNKNNSTEYVILTQR